MRALFLTIAIVASTVVCSRDAFAQTTQPSIPQPSKTMPSTTAPTKTAPSKTQTAKTKTPATQSKSHQAGKQYGHGHGRGGGVGFGVGATIDLGGIGQRRAEPDPFAVPAERQPVIARTEEKPKTPKKPREVAKTDPFAGVELTGKQAKEQSNPQ